MWEKYKGDERAIVQAFKTYGVTADRVVWNREGIRWTDYSAVLIRSTWDYCRDGKFERFISVLRNIDSLGVPLFNSFETVLWNSRKTYLKELAAKGVPCIETIWLEGKNIKLLPELIQNQNWTECVLKPTVSAGGFNTFRIRNGNVASVMEEAEKTGIQEWMLQPFIPEIVEEGEWSFIFIDGEPVVTDILKKPAKGNFLVQDLHGGTIHRVKPAEKLVKQAQVIFHQMQRDPLVARVDLVDTKTGPRVMEIEMIEPFLFFDHANSLAKTYAWATVRRLHTMNKLFACTINKQEFTFVATELARFREKIGVLHKKFLNQPAKHAVKPELFIEGEKIKPVNNDNDFPKTITNYKVTVTYNTYEELKNALEVIGESVCSIYATFLTEEGHKTRSPHLFFYEYPTRFPTLDQVENFKKRLKNAIIEALLEDPWHVHYAGFFLKVDTWPQATLFRILSESGIDLLEFEASKLFPQNTTTFLRHYQEDKSIQITLVGGNEWLKKTPEVMI